MSTPIHGHLDMSLNISESTARVGVGSAAAVNLTRSQIVLFRSQQFDRMASGVVVEHDGLGGGV